MENRLYTWDRIAAIKSYAWGSDIAEDEELPVGQDGATVVDHEHSC